MSDLVRVVRTSAPRPRPKDEELGFGTVFTDHMFLAEYRASGCSQDGSGESGWHDPRIEPYGPLLLDPAAAVLHYGQSVFEGIKAFRGVDGQVRLFRPERHLARLGRSAERMCIPPLDPDLALAWLTELVHLEQDWVPASIGSALYVRPTIIASEAFLGVRPARSYLYFVVLSPVGAYYGECLTPVKIRVEEQYVRAVAGGTGGAKTGGNYAGALLAAQEAHRDGFTQVLWLDGIQRKYLDEVGTMNIMLRIGDEVVTPPAGSTILSGVVRDSALTLLRDWGLTVAERPIAIDEVVAAARRGTLREMWGTGTAAVISPVGEFAYQGERFAINGGSVGEVTRRLYDALLAVQYAQAPDSRHWMHLV